MPLQDDYQVTLDMFKGPLDLLLYLIRRAEVDIHDIPIAQITDQYLAFLHQIEVVDIDLAGEFLVMAATLIEIKSRTLMPAERRSSSGSGSEDGSDDGDPRYELVQQLLAYQRYRTASESLDTARQRFADRFPGGGARIRLATEETDDQAAVELDDANPYELFDVYHRIMDAIDLNRLGDHTVEVDDTPIALHQDDLLDQLRRSRQQQITLQQAFEGKSAGQRVGLFLATLELVRMRRVTVTQDDISDLIVLTLNDDPTDLSEVGTDSEQSADRAAEKAEPASNNVPPHQQ